MANFNVWSRGADPIWPEPESAPGPRTSGVAQKSGGSATLLSEYQNAESSGGLICIVGAGGDYSHRRSTNTVLSYRLNMLNKEIKSVHLGSCTSSRCIS